MTTSAGWVAHPSPAPSGVVNIHGRRGYSSCPNVQISSQTAGRTLGGCVAPAGFAFTGDAREARRASRASFVLLQPSARYLEVRTVLVSLGALVLVGAIRAWLQWIGPLPGDRYAAAHAQAPPSFDSAGVRRVTSFFSSLGTPVVASSIVLVGLVVLCFWADPRTVAGLLVACIVIPLNALLKVLSGPTPLWSQAHEFGHNFPSGHVAFATCVIGYLGWVAVRRKLWPLALLALLLILGMGPARVLSGAHLVSDVVAGYLVGAAVLVPAVAAGINPVPKET